MTDDGSKSFYGEDLARAHADGFANHWDGAADWLRPLADVEGETPYVVDVGCGDGRMLAMLAERGLPGSGIDISSAFVAAAHARGLDAEVANAKDLSLPRATLVIALGEVLAYMDADGDTAFEHIVREAAAKLVPGGSLVFDVTGPEVPESTGWRDGGDWVVASRLEISGAALTRTVLSFTRCETGWRRTDETHRQKLFTPEEIEAALSGAAFDFRRLDAVGETRMLPGRIAYAARKSG